MTPTAIIALFVILAVGAFARPAQDNSGNSQAGSAAASDAGVQANDKKLDPAGVTGNIEILTDTQGVDFGPYLSKVLRSVREKWYRLMPEEARPPQQKQGEVTLEFAILRGWNVAGLTLRRPSGVIPLDRAAWGAIVSSAPFAPLPDEFKGKYLGLRMPFYYNPLRTPQTKTSSQESKP